MSTLYEKEVKNFTKNPETGETYTLSMRAQPVPSTTRTSKTTYEIVLNLKDGRNHNRNLITTTTDTKVLKKTSGSHYNVSALLAERAATLLNTEDNGNFMRNIIIAATTLSGAYGREGMDRARAAEATNALKSSKNKLLESMNKGIQNYADLLASTVPDENNTTDHPVKPVSAQPAQDTPVAISEEYTNITIEAPKKEEAPSEESVQVETVDEPEETNVDASRTVESPELENNLRAVDQELLIANNNLHPENTYTAPNKPHENNDQTSLWGKIKRFFGYE
jgi:hypothetical protein